MSTHDDDTCPHLVVLGRLEAENARLIFEIEVHREGWDSNDAWEYHCKFEVAKMYAIRDALKPDSDPNTPSTAV
jgi:hypothetical protein